MKKFKDYLLIILISAMTVAGGAIYYKMTSYTNMEENVDIVIDGNTCETLKANITDLYPGKTSEYFINLINDTEKDYFITIKFYDDDGGLLKNFLLVEIKTENITIQKELKELINGEEINIGKGSSKIIISYTMPKDVGNESQGTSVKFFIDLYATFSETVKE